MSTVVKDLGAVSAYAYAVEKGYTGTEAEFAELMASYAEVGQTATDAAESALNSKTAAQTAATTATNKASEATTAAQTATTKAGEASQSASDANTAKEEAVTAKTAAETAQGKAEDAQAAAESVAESIPSDYSQLSEDVSDLKEDINDYDKYIVGVQNLLDGVKLINDYYLNDSGVATSMSDFYYTTPIPVTAGKEYTLYLQVGASTNPFRVHGYDANGDWQELIKKEAIGGVDVLATLSFTVPSGVTQIRLSSYYNKVLKILVPYGFEMITDSLSHKVIKSVPIDFANMINGYKKKDGTITVSGNWKHVALNNVPAGSTISATAYCTDSIDQISLFDSDDNYMTGIQPSSSGISTHSLVTPVSGTVYINFSSSYGATGQISYLVADPNAVGDLKTSTEIPYLTMFHKIGVCGDSLSSGEIWDGSNVDDCYQFSWLSNIARNIGVECVHYSKGGLTSKAWWSDADGYKTALANESTKPLAYYIAFGTNDKNQQDYPIGSISDVAGTDSFVGYMRSIVEYVHTQQPNAVIFLLSTYNASALSAPYNAMIEDIADLYSYCFFIDYAKEGAIKTTQTSVYVENSHFTTIGYVAAANVIKTLTENAVKNNISFFKHFGLNNYS